MAMLRTIPNMTLAAEWDIKSQLWTGYFLESGSRDRIKPTLYKPLLAPVTHPLFINYHCKDASYTSEKLSTEAYGPVTFIELNFGIFILICRHKRTHLNPGEAPVIQPAPSPQPPPPTRRKRNTPNSWAIPWVLQREDRGYHNNLLSDLIQTDIPGY